MSITWADGNFVEALTLDVAERGLALGDGVFETILVRGAKAIWLGEHLARMGAAAQELGIPCDEAHTRFAVAAILKRSTAPSESLRITLTRGPTPRGLTADGAKPSLILSLNPFDRAKLTAVTRLITSTVRRNPFSPASRLKTLSYIDAIVAAREASGRADDALMLNTPGDVASTTIANIFCLKNKTLITPPLATGILPGIARQKLLDLAGSLDLSAQEQSFTPTVLTSADLVFTTNSLRLATQVVSLDGTALPTHDMLSKINAAFERSFS